MRAITEPTNPIDQKTGFLSPTWLTFALIFAATFIVYIPALKAGFIWDDDFHVFANPHLLDLSGLWRIWFTTESQQYYPLVYSSFWIEHHLWGNNPLGYHAVNVFLHAVNASLVFVILRRLSVPGAIAAALIFALHPVHVESVAWVSERKNVLSGLFYLLSLLAYLKFDDDNDEGGKRFYPLALILFLMALMSKTVVSSLPAVLLIITWMRGREINSKTIARLAPFFILGLAFGLLTVMWEVKFVGASGAEWTLGIAERLLLPGRVACFYLYKLFLPLKLTFIYPRWTLDVSAIWQWSYGALMIILLIILWAKRTAIGRAPLSALLFFLITLFPALGFFNVYPFRYSFVADHFQYMASVGIITLAVAVAAYLLKERSQKAGVALTVLVCVILGAMTLAQGRAYKDYETLWLDTIEKNPKAWIAHNNLGNAMAARGRANEAKGYFQTTIRLAPFYPVAYFNMGNALTKEGELEKANKYYREAIARDSEYARAHFNLAGNLYSLARFSAAAEHYKRAEELEPENISFLLNLANTFVRLGRYDEAIAGYSKILTIDPSSKEALRNIEIARKRGR